MLSLQAKLLSRMLQVFPVSCLQDEPSTLIAKDLLANQQITLACHLKDVRGSKFFSYAHYLASKDGVVDVSKDESLGGRFTGLFRMGLIGTLIAEPTEFSFLRVFKRDVEVPNKIEYRLYHGFHSEESIFKPDVQCLASTLHYRYFMRPGVQRIPITEGRVRGTLFIPPGPGPFPSVLDLFGTAGGLLEYRSSQLASRGVMSLALAFFGFEDLPDGFSELDINYFKEAAEILLSHKKAMKPYIGAIGVSKGGDLVLSMATHIPEVKLVICINGSYANLSVPLRVNENEVIPPLAADLSRIKIVEGKYIMTREMVNDPKTNPRTIIPLHRSDAMFYFFVGGDDQSMKVLSYAYEAVKMLRSAGKDNYKVCYYPKAGHLIEPPYSTHCAKSYHKMIDLPMLWGGSAKEHSEAQVKAWQETLNAFREHLCNINSKL